MRFIATDYTLFFAAGLLLTSQAVRAQSPVVTALAPARHAVAAPAAGPVALGFSQAITAVSAPNLRVYSSQRRGRRLGFMSGGGTASLSFAPTQSFAPGERVSVSVPPTLLNAAGVGVTRQVYQFTAATGGTGRGVFLDTTEVAPTHSRDQLLGDIDNDGDLDLLTTAGLFGMYSFLNNGAGVFTPYNNVVMASTPSGVALADFNQDGFLDLIVGDADNPSVAIALNDGTGTFGVLARAGQTLAVGATVASVATGDLDGDGDLDFATANYGGSSASIGFNNGSGFFANVATISMGTQPTTVQLADVDNDGDLDLLTSNRGSNSVSIRLNNGLGSFGGVTSVAVGIAPSDVVLADIDGDGDLDLLTTNAGAATVSVRLNAAGSFTGSTVLALPANSTPTGLSTGDVDADGDLDVVVAQGAGGQIITFLNNGSGSFTAQASVLTLAVAASGPGSSAGVALGDVDGDGDLDLITAESSAGRVVLGLGNATPTLSGFSPAGGTPGTVVALTGTNLAGARRITFVGATGNVVSAGFAVNAAGTQLTGVTVPNGAVSGPISVTTGGGTASSSASFAVSAAQLNVLQNGTLYLPAGAGFNFGNQAIGTASVPTTFTLANPGALPLLISNAMASGSFSVLGAVTASVPAGGSATVTVVFQPATIGGQTGMLTITSNAAGLPSYVLPLRGTGVVPPPTVVSCAPASAPVGNDLVINGINLAGATAVTFAGTANNTVTTGFGVNGAGTQLTGLVVPAGAVSGLLRVSTPGGVSAGFAFAVLPPQPPVITSISPGSGLPGNTLTLTGINFLGATIVFFGGSPTTSFQVVSSTTITVTVPTIAQSGVVTVETPAGISNGATFQFAPFLKSLFPIAGCAGMYITIDGTALGGASDVQLNGLSIPIALVSGALTFTVPVRARSGLLTISTAAGTSNGLAFTVTSLVTLDGVAPLSGLAGSTVTLTGTNLTGTTAVIFTGVGVNTVMSGFTVNAAGTQLTVVVPSGAQTGNVTVRSPNGIPSGTAFTVTGTPVPTAPAWQSATAMALDPSGGSGGSVLAVATDASGNVYLGGTFRGTITLGNIVLTYSSNTHCGFVAKWSPTTGTFLWAKQIDSYDATVNALAVSGSSVYVTGTYYRYATLGAIGLTAASGVVNTFVAKLTDAGSSASFIWAQPAGGPNGNTWAYALAVQGSSVYIAGSFNNATFGSITPVGTGTVDAYVAKLTDAGSSASFVWVQPAGGLQGDEAWALAVNGTSVYVAGKYDSSTANFGPVTLHTTTNTALNVYDTDGFVAKLTDAGSTSSFIWAQRMGGTGTDFINALAVQGSNLYVAGRFQHAASLGTLAFNSASAYGGVNGFVAKLADAGSSSSAVWGQTMYAIFGSSLTQALAVNGSSIYVAGNIDSKVQFGDNTLFANGNTECYVAKIADAGAASSFAWVQAGGGPGGAVINGVGVFGTHIYVGGGMNTPNNFGQFLLNPSIGGYVGFLASLTDGVLTATAAAVPRTALGLYPNPAHATATLQLPPAAAATSATVIIADALGRIVRTETVAVPVEGLRYELRLTGLSPGLYLLRVTAGTFTAGRQLVIE